MVIRMFVLADTMLKVIDRSARNPYQLRLVSLRPWRLLPVPVLRTRVAVFMCLVRPVPSRLPLRGLGDLKVMQVFRVSRAL